MTIKSLLWLPLLLSIFGLSIFAYIFVPFCNCRYLIIWKGMFIIGVCVIGRHSSVVSPSWVSNTKQTIPRMYFSFLFAENVSVVKETVMTYVPSCVNVKCPLSDSCERNELFILQDGFQLMNAAKQ